MKKILVTEDEQDVLSLLSDILKSEQYEVLQAQNGIAAIKAAKEHHPDLMLLDVMMPELDGFEVCRQIKADPATRDIKVVIVTARNTAGDIKEGLAAGADYYFTKPMKVIELFTKIKELIG